VKNTLGGVGMHPGASLSYDGYDDLPLPQLFNSVEMNFKHPEFFAKVFDRDVVPPQDDFTWEFSVESNMKGMAELAWENPSVDNKELYLFDIALQKPVNMMEVNRYGFDPSASQRFRIYYGVNLREKIKPDFILLGKAYPNPTSKSTTIPFNLPQYNSSYQVSLQVFDVMGNKVATLVEGEMGPGFYSTDWNTSLSNLGDGLYIYRLVVADQKKNGIQSGKITIQK
jgi:hypothetical protein